MGNFGSIHSKVSYSIVIPAVDLRIIDTAIHILHCVAFEEYEVLIIMNNCSYVTYETVRNSIKKVDNAHIIVYYIGSATIGKARNYGIRISKGEYIIHMDSDCIIGKNFLTADSRENLTGKSVVRGDVRFLHSKALLDKSNCVLKNFAYKRREISYTPNLIIKKEVHYSGLWFDEKLLYGEDTELSMRLLEKGYSPVNQPQFSMLHIDDAKTYQILIKYFRYGLARAYRYEMIKGKHNFFTYYRKVFGEIPSIRNKVSYNIYLCILFLYFIRNIGVIYGIIRIKLVK